MKKRNKKRITILTADEIDELYKRPTFNQAEREEYFALDDKILRRINKLEKFETKLYLILLIGYFRAKPVVPKFRPTDIKDDVAYLCKTYFDNKKPAFGVMRSMPKSTRSKIVAKMLSILDFKRFDQKQQQSILIARLQDVATICTDPRYVFDECLAFFGQNRIALAAYSTLQDLTADALSTEQKRTELVLSENMSGTTQQRLQQILYTKGTLNSLSMYKGSARDFSPSELQRELRTHNTIKPIYPELVTLIRKLSLSQGNLAYYASVIKHRSIYTIRHYSQWQSLLYLVCYLYFRYRETNDNLVTAFCYLTRKQNEAAKAFAKQRLAEELEVIRDKLKYAGNLLSYFVDDSVNDTTQFGEIRKKAFALISKDEIQVISQHLGEKDFDFTDYEWQYTDKQARKTASTLRKLFIAIDIECEENHTVLKKQITLAKSELLQKGKIASADQRFINKQDRAYLVQDSNVNTKRFEFYLYHRAHKMLESGKLYVTESEQNQRLENDLISPHDWQKNRNDIIRKTGLERLKNPIHETLASLESQMKGQLKRVSKSINADTNDFVKRQQHTDQLAWSVASKRWKDDIDNPVYSQIQHMGIIDIMNYVNRKTGFLQAYKYAGTKKQGMKVNRNDLIACIFGNGANYGLYRMANVSDRSVGTLRTVNDGYIRPETSGAANDIISDAIAKLPIFKSFTINETAPFGSVDGQKHGCRINTFKARYSAKYFRRGKGVSALTLVSNHVPVNTTVISPNEYEGHYAFDLLYNNSSDIQPKILTTDNHGVNRVNFAILDIFGYRFAPRYAKFKKIFHDQFEIIPGDKISIRLKKPFNRKLIEQYWEEIQRIMCSLSRKTTTQSTIVKKLSNRKNNSRVIKALHEYDRLIKCLYLLEYVDSKTLRQFVQQALNRGEAYHQLRKTIASLNGNQFRGGDDYQIEQWNDCARVIANCIIYYNSAVLSTLIERFKKRRHKKAVAMLYNLSPIAWRHIQLAGRYTFGDQKMNIDLASMLEDVDPLADNFDQLMVA